MFCSNCGSQIDDGFKFCGKCGTAVQPIVQSVAPQQPTANAPYCLYMDSKGVTLLNYKFDVKSADGMVRYRAATVTEGLMTSNARIYYPNDAEALIIRQQKKMTLAAMNFDMLSADNKLITEVLQKIHLSKYEFHLPSLGLMVTGDFLAVNYVFTRGNQTVAAVRKKIVSWGDCYELEIYDSSLEQVLLGTIMVIQMVIAASRRRRR